MFIWSGIGVPTMSRSVLSPLEVVRFFGRISYSLYLWHWPLFTFARFAKDGLVLDATDKLALFLATIAISYLSWRFIEQPFRDRTLVPTRRAAFGLAGLSSACLLVASAGGLIFSQTLSDADRHAIRLEAYNNYDMKPAYRSGICFAPPNGVFAESCLSPVAGKTNWLLWGDSFAAQYYPGLRLATGPLAVNLLQATQPACMPTLNAALQYEVSCREFAARMQEYFNGNKPDLVIMSADWLEYGRSWRFDSVIADLGRTIAALSERGIAVVLLGPSIQFRARLPAMLLRAHLRGVEPRSEAFLLPDIFSFDERMKTAMASRADSFISIVDAVCPKRQCPLTLDGVPLSFDHAHLTAEGSAYVMDRVVPLLPKQP